MTQFWYTWFLGFLMGGAFGIAFSAALMLWGFLKKKP